MLSDDNHRWAHMMPMACNICTCNVFATSSFNFRLPTYFVSHYCCRRALPYMQCPIEEFLNKKVKQGCLKWYGKCHVKGHPYCTVCWCAWWNLVSFSLQKTTIHINFLECSVSWDRCFALIPLFVDFVSLSDILAPHDSKYRFSSIGLMTVLRVVYTTIV